MVSLLNIILETVRKVGAERDNGGIRIKRYKGRKNIKQVFSESELTVASQNAKLIEDKRRTRVVERQKRQNEFFVNGENSSRLILEVSSVNHEPIVEVNPELVKLAKPHQVKGIRFMWDCVIESVDMVEQNGSGCILAHSMGLGKTFQIITFLHTVLTHRVINQHIKYALIICPVNTIKNWFSEFQQWLGGGGLLVFSVYDLSDSKTQLKRAETLKAWRQSGGVLLCGLTLFSQLVNPKGKKMKCSKRICDTFIEALVRSGPDIVIIDEGHLLKNNQSNFNAAVSSITTLRRIILTGTPLQNNLEEYYVMVNFVKPYLLGTKKEFSNRFVNPINNGQHIDSTPKDVAIMKKSVHVLHKFLDGFVQRFDYTILKPYLQPKFEFVISIKLTKIQIELYRHYLENVSKCDGSSILEDFANLRLIWNHPDLLYRVYAKRDKKQSSMPDEVDSMSTFDSSDSDEFDVSSELSESGSQSYNVFQNSWFDHLLSSCDTAQVDLSSKMLVLFHILEKCEEIGDK
uniref:transcriptional regulator ATRX homolog n=1 Tax=Cynara cardunculus var. scolymus TaxID=59895 RepID=UPI000D62799B